MNQCLAKPRKPAYKPRSDHGWYMGSQPAGQRLVDPAIHGVQPPDEHMGFVQGCPVKGCPAPSSQRPVHIRASMRPGDTRPSPRTVRDPLPPTPYGSVAGAYLKFSPVFQRNGQ